MLDLSRIEDYRENNRIEAKKALGGLPHSVWETYGAFANTLGGLILLGVEELKDKSFRAVDLPDPEGMVEEFWRIIDDRKRISANILVEDNVRIEEVDGCRIIVIRVPRASRKVRPILIDDVCYRRNGEGDYKCRPEEVRSLTRAAGLKEGWQLPVIEYLTDEREAPVSELAALLDMPEEHAYELLMGLVDIGLLITLPSDADKEAANIDSVRFKLRERPVLGSSEAGRTF